MTSPPFMEFDKDLKTRDNEVGALKDCGCFMAKWETLSGCHDTLFKKIIDNPNVSYELEFDYNQDILGYARTAGMLELGVREIVKLTEKPTHYKFRMKKCKKGVTLGCSDQEFLAVLDLNQVEDLAMKTKDGERTIGAKPSTFLITAGKPLMDRISKGKKGPPEYRVTMKDEQEQKYWVGLFAYYDEGKIEVGSSSHS